MTKIDKGYYTYLIAQYRILFNITEDAAKKRINKIYKVVSAKEVIKEQIKLIKETKQYYIPSYNRIKLRIRQN